MGKSVGYIRVSTVEQNTDRQLAGVKLDKVFTDKCSGGSTNRPALQEMLDWIREEDVLYVHSMDRLARSLVDLRGVVDQVNAKGAVVKFVKENLEFAGQDSPMSDLMLNLLGAVAQFERALIRERQREGIEAAKKRGVYRGRRKSLTDCQILELREKVKNGIPKSRLAREFGISRGTVYTYLNEN